MKKFKELFKKLLDKDVIVALLVVLGLAIHFYYFNDILFNKPINPTWIDAINSIVLLISTTAFLGFIYICFFHLLTKDAEFIENWVLKNLTKVCYFIGILLIISFILKYLTKELFLTSFGALIVFWYGYKTYERDKELQMIEKFDKGELTIDNFDEDLSKLSHAFYLHEKGYLPDHIWRRIEIRNDKIIYDFFNENLKGKDINQFLNNNKISDTLAKIKYEGGFMDYFTGKIEDFYHTLDEHDFSLKEKQEMDKITNSILKLYQLINQKTN